MACRLLMGVRVWTPLYRHGFSPAAPSRAGSAKFESLGEMPITYCVNKYTGLLLIFVEAQVNPSVSFGFWQRNGPICLRCAIYTVTQHCVLLLRGEILAGSVCSLFGWGCRDHSTIAIGARCCLYRLRIFLGINDFYTHNVIDGGRLISLKIATVTRHRMVFLFCRQQGGVVLVLEHNMYGSPDP
jgi:hypothetical protein